MRYVYLIGAMGSELVKIGSAADPEKRLQTLQVGSPVALHILWKRMTWDAYRLESDLHSHFRAKRAHGEWFRLGPDPVAVVTDAVAFIRDERMEGFPFSLSALADKRFQAAIRAMREAEKD